MMRIWARKTDQKTGRQTWVATSGNTAYVTWLQNVLKLKIGESPFWADRGLPAHENIVTKLFPDLYVDAIRQQFSGYFRSLKISKGTEKNGEIEYTANTTPLVGDIQAGPEWSQNWPENPS